jgi:hypothetical protein
MITLHMIKPNLTRVYVGELDVVFSYETPVAVTLPTGKRYQTERKFSKTTTRHIRETGFGDAEVIPHDDLLNIIHHYTNTRSLT